MGLLGFLDAASTSAEVQQILLVDGPAVLGWQRWRDLEERYGLGAIRLLLDQALAEGTIAPQPIDVLAHILLAAVDEAALFIAHSSHRRSAKNEAVISMNRLLKRDQRVITHAVCSGAGCLLVDPSTGGRAHLVFESARRRWCSRTANTAYHTTASPTTTHTTLAAVRS